jgi:hypothetical protein
MTDKNAALESVPDLKPTARPLITVDTEKIHRRTAKRTDTVHETVLQQLRRILGEPVLELIPKDVQEAVEAAYIFWKEHSDSYLITPFDDQQGRDDALAVMKAYAEIAPNGPYTIRTDKDSEPEVLLWRAQTRQGRKTEDE